MLIFWILLAILLAIILFAIIPIICVSIYVYRLTLVRINKDKWKRECSALDNQEQVTMYQRGLSWAEKEKEFKKEISITSFDNLKLVGEYFDFGFSKAVIILQGRTESLLYSYYYAKPYKDIGYNVLVIDPRAHGLSEGRYTSVGFNEAKDLLIWCKTLHEQYNINTIFLHGICIGGATSLYLATSQDCPPYVKGLLTDGLFTTFYETYVNHMKSENRPVFPFALIVFLLLRIKTGAKARKYGPYIAIKELKLPILMIASKQDAFSLEAKTIALYESCSSKIKKLKLFDKGAHSHVRINQEKEYDDEIISFINSYIK